MPVVTKRAKTHRAPKRQSKKTKPTPTPKNGHRIAGPVQMEGIYMLRPRRTPEALRRAKRLRTLVQKELEGKTEGTLEETMQTLRGLSWS